VGLLVAAGVAFSGWRRRDAFVTALGLMPLAACPVAVWSATRIVGEVMPYLLVWDGVLLLPTWIAAGLLLRPVSHRRAAGGVPGAAPSVAGLAVVVGLALTWSILRAPLPPVRSDPAVPAVMTMVRPWLAGHSTERLRLRIGQHDQWPLAAGVIDRLDRDGLDVTVDREWVSLFGDQFAPTGREGSELWLTGPTATPPARDPQHLGTVSGASVWAALPDQRGRP
jgi:hypothetical protein